MTKYIIINGVEVEVQQRPSRGRGSGRKGKNVQGTHHGDKRGKWEKPQRSSLLDPLATALRDSNFE